MGDGSTENAHHGITDELVDSATTGSAIELIAGPMMGQIGSLITAVSGNQGYPPACSG